MLVKKSINVENDPLLDDKTVARSRIMWVAKLLPLISFVVPMIVLYSLYPGSFEQTYQGRTFHLFFLWLVCLEMILDWERLTLKLKRWVSLRTLLLIVTLSLPTTYVIVANYYGLNTMIADAARPIIPAEDRLRDQHAGLVALSTEYIVFALLFCLIIVLQYGAKRLMDFSLSAFFAGVIGILFTVDNLAPYGRIAPLQAIVPATATLAERVLNMLGYATSYAMVSDPVYGTMPLLMVRDYPWARFSIAWPCSGVESLLIYCVTVLLFLKRTAIPLWHKAVYFIVGAVVTYLINILRIVTLFMIAIQKGPTFTVLDYDFQRFHNYYGMLYSMTWIIAYPLLIMGTRALWMRIKQWNAARKGDFNLSRRIEPSIGKDRLETN